MIVVLWYTTEKGSNCPINDVITDISDCIHASKKLDFVCGGNNKCGTIKEHADMPAGCFYTSRDHSSLNQVILPNKTQPENHAGGICSITSTFIQYFVLIGLIQ